MMNLMIGSALTGKGEQTMPDREKVIKGLNDIGGFIAERIGIEQARNFLRTIDDALALLKEQEAVVPFYTTNSHPFHIGILYRCGNCHHSLIRDEDLFCRRCGKPIDWTKKAVKLE